MKKFLLFLIFVNFIYQIQGDIFPEFFFKGKIDINDGDIFYWYFKSRNDPQKDPLLIWLGNGEGISIERDIFYGNGPFNIRQQIVEKNKFSWNEFTNVIYVDFPIGSGFSQNQKNFERFDEEKLKEYFGVFIIQLYMQFTQLEQKSVFLGGSGKQAGLIPYFANFLLDEIYIKNKFALKGIIMNSPEINKKIQFLSLLEYSEKKKLINPFVKYLLFPAYKIAYQFLNKNFNFGLQFSEFLKNLILKNIKGQYKFNPYNIKVGCFKQPLCYDYSEINKFLNNEKVLLELGIPLRKWEILNENQKNNFKNQNYIQTSKELKKLLNTNIQVYIIYGENQFENNYIGGINSVNKIPWNYQEIFENIPFTQTKNYYTKKVEKLELRVIKNNGEQISIENPEKIQKLFKKIILNN